MPSSYNPPAASVSYPITADKGGTGVVNNAASTITISGNFGTTFTVSGATTLTLPTSGTLVTVAGVPAAISGQPINPITIGAMTPADSIFGFNITAGGSVNGAGNVSGGFLLSNSTVYIRSNTGDIRLGASDDVILARAAANTFALRNSTNGQTFVISRTYTDPGNYSQGAVAATGSTIDFLTQTAGTGVGTLTGWTFDKPVRLKGYTVATLPSGVTGDTAYVTDALLPAFLATVAGGGAVVTKVFYNGTNWVSQ